MLTPPSLVIFFSVQINLLNLVLPSRHLFTLYRTNSLANEFQHDCLHYYVHESQGQGKRVQQIIEYCLRPAQSSGFLYEKNDSDGDGFTFDILRSNNITSQQLYSWSAPIDVVESYQIYLDNTFPSDVMFYNCSPPYFGHQCMYTFILHASDVSLADVVNITFQDRRKFSGALNTITNLTCYTHIECDHGLSLCLDWREICDGKVDCVNGGPDEANCFILELNECTEKTEYRCQNGAHCIPGDWVQDGRDNIDCLDGSDESLDSLKFYKSLLDPTIRTEDRTQMLTVLSSFSCGDGLYSIIFECPNQRGEFAIHAWLEKFLLESEFSEQLCGIATICQTEIAYKINSEHLCDRYCGSKSCNVIIKQYCPPLFFFPPTLRLHGHVRFLFTNNASNDTRRRWISMLPYICYQEELCENLIFFNKPPEIWFDGLACMSISDINSMAAPHFDGDMWISNFQLLVEYMYRLFHSCLPLVPATNKEFSNQTDSEHLYHCISSRKYISHHRILDGRMDCPRGDDEIDAFNKSCSINNYRFICPNKVYSQGDCPAMFLMANWPYSCFHANRSLSEKYYIPSFPLLCDGKNESIPVVINGLDYTDESECDYFPCNNTYTRCDGFWSCLNGADEVNCPPSPCPPGHHQCVLPATLTLECLPIERFNNGIVDCLGGSDERLHCRQQETKTTGTRFRCWNSTKCVNFAHLCDQDSHCRFYDDEIFCETERRIPITVCAPGPQTPVENFLCNNHDAMKINKRYLSLHEDGAQVINLTISALSVTRPTSTTVKPKLDNIITVSSTFF